MSAWAIIPARGGSKGLPRKNLAAVPGRSLLGRAIDTCRAASLVDRVVVSTDSIEIAHEAIRYGAEVVERPTEISNDYSSSEQALSTYFSKRRSVVLRSHQGSK